MVHHRGVRTGEVQALVAVGPLDDVGRSPIGPPDLDHDGVAVGLGDVMPADDDLVSHLGTHGFLLVKGDSCQLYPPSNTARTCAPTSLAPVVGCACVNFPERGIVVQRRESGAWCSSVSTGSLVPTGSTPSSRSGGTSEAGVFEIDGPIFDQRHMVWSRRGARLASDVIATSDDPGRLGRSAYAYFHVPMVAGIIARAVADELTIAHPGGDVTAGTAAVILGGAALYLAQRPVQVDPVRTLVVVTGRGDRRPGRDAPRRRAGDRDRPRRTGRRPREDAPSRSPRRSWSPIRTRQAHRDAPAAPALRWPFEAPRQLVSACPAAPVVGQMPSSQLVPVALHEESTASRAPGARPGLVMHVARVHVLQPVAEAPLAGAGERRRRRVRDVHHLEVRMEGSEVEGHVGAEMLGDP